MSTAKIDSSYIASSSFLQDAIDVFPDPIFIKDRAHRFTGCNASLCRLIGRSREEIIGADDTAFFPADQVRVFWELDDQLLNGGVPNENEEMLTDGNGSVRRIWTRKYPMRAADGQIVGLCGIITDVTPIRARLELAAELAAENQKQKAALDAQSALLDRLAAPLIQIWRGVLLLPMIGALSARRASQIRESALAAIVHTRSTFLLIDITGVPTVDDSSAVDLLRTVQAAQLLGCRSIVCGIGAETARTLVSLNVNFAGLQTRSTLQDGLQYALGILASPTATPGAGSGESSGR